MMLDSSPEGSINAAAIAAVNVRSAFQSALVMLRCRLSVTWGALAPGVVALIESVSW